MQLTVKENSELQSDLLVGRCAAEDRAALLSAVHLQRSFRAAWGAAVTAASVHRRTGLMRRRPHRHHHWYRWTVCGLHHLRLLSRNRDTECKRPTCTSDRGEFKASYRLHKQMWCLSCLCVCTFGLFCSTAGDLSTPTGGGSLFYFFHVNVINHCPVFITTMKPQFNITSILTWHHLHLISAALWLGEWNCLPAACGRRSFFPLCFDTTLCSSPHNACTSLGSSQEESRGQQRRRWEKLSVGVLLIG